MEIISKATLAGVLGKLSEESSPYLLIELRINRAAEVVRLCEPDGVAAEEKLVDALENRITGEFGDGTIYKLGFDSFLVILKGRMSDHTERLDAFVHSSFHMLFELDGRKYYPKFLFGITPLERDIGRTFSRLEFASGKAAATAGVTSVFIDINDPRIRDHENRRAGLREVRAALEEFELGLFFQPIVPIGNDGEHTKFEILLRHYKTASRPISPANILKTAAYNRVMPEIDLYVVELLCKNYHRLFGSKDWKIDALSINISGASYASPLFAEALNRIVSNYGVSAEKLILEVTEDVANSAECDAIQTMEMLKNFGYGLALDDIGTGSSNFQNLRTYPVDYYKIDRAYCEGMLKDQQTRNFVELVVGLGKENGKQIIAEGVPDQATLHMLGGMGVDYSQSFITGKPRELIIAPKYSLHERLHRA